MNLFKLSLLGALALLVGACSFINYSSLEHYTLKGTLSANTGLELWTHYEPVNPNDSACSYKRFSSGTMERRRAGDTLEIKAQPNKQPYQVKIPRYIVVKGCKTEFQSARTVPVTKVNGIEYSTTGMGVSKFGLENAQKNQRLSEINCSWRFKIGPAREHPNTDIDKHLNCKATTIPLAINQTLDNNTFILNINILKTEEPSCKGCWIKVPTGWKSCINLKNPKTDGFCTTPPKFRTFKHKGKTCTVYPSCTE